MNFSFGRLLAGVAATLALAAPAWALDKVQFNLAWLPQGSTGGVLVAIANGYYKEAGLDVTAVRGYGGQRTVNEVDQGLFEFGYGDPISVILNRAQGGNTVMISAINTRYPGMLCYLQGKKALAAPADLKGMSLGGGAASPVQNMLPVWLQDNKLPADYVKLLRLDPNVINTALLEGRIDLAECWEGASHAVLERLVTQEGKQLGTLKYRDFNLDVYGNGIVTSDKLIKSNPDLVKRFLKATYRGFEFQRQNPAKAAQLIAGQNRMLDAGILEEQIKETNVLITDPEANGGQLGWMRPDRMQRSLDVVQRAFPNTAGIRLDDIYTNRFLN